MRYAKYKPTGIAWLPELPEEWEMRRLKSLFVQRNESYDPNEKLIVLSLLKDVGVIPYDEKGLIGNKSKDDYSTYNVARKGDVVMNSMNVIIGSVDITPYDGYISPAYYALTARDNVDTRYYNYIFHLTKLQKAMRALAKGILEIRLRISTTSLFGMAYPYPPLATQRAIVAFLDERCGAVDRLVAAKEKEVALLKELKQSVIAEAVTRGVPHAESADNDLTQRAQSSQSASSPRSLRSPRENDRRLVPSGIPWLPELPEGWEVRRLKWIFEEIKNLSTTGEELPLSLTASNGLIPFSEKTNKTMESESYVGAKIVEKGQIVFNRFKARLFAIAPCRGLVSPDYAVYSTKIEVEKRYLLALLGVPAFRQAMNNQASGIGDGFSRLYSSELFKLVIPVPPLGEQREIVAHIEAKTAKIDAAAAGLEKEIAALKEWKQRLIADVVTGQIKVA